MAASPLQEKLRRQGQWLFRWRSYLPLPLLGAVATWLYFHAPPDEGTPRHMEWEAVCLVVGFTGVALRIWVAGLVPGGTSGRNTRAQRADRLNTSGPYSLVRHPLYVANFLMWLAVALFTRSPGWVVIASAYFWCCYERIMLAEEHFLLEKFGEEYRSWAARTPALLPAFGRWRSPELDFSWRTALRREYSGLMGLVAALALLEVTEEIGAPVPFRLEPEWVVLLAVTGVLYVVLRTLKRHTSVLRASGR